MRSVLDLGCGTGRTLARLAAHVDEVWGIDISPVMVNLARVDSSRHAVPDLFVATSAG